MFLGKKKDVVGLDIGSSSIKLVEPNRGKGGFKLQNLGLSPLPPEGIVDGALMDSVTIIDAIRDLVSTTKTKRKEQRKNSKKSQRHTQSCTMMRNVRCTTNTGMQGSINNTRQKISSEQLILETFSGAWDLILMTSSNNSLDDEVDTRIVLGRREEATSAMTSKSVLRMPIKESTGN
jgi:hypothetical protein